MVDGCPCVTRPARVRLVTQLSPLWASGFDYLPVLDRRPTSSGSRFRTQTKRTKTSCAAITPIPKDLLSYPSPMVGRIDDEPTPIAFVLPVGPPVVLPVILLRLRPKRPAPLLSVVADPLWTTVCFYVFSPRSIPSNPPTFHRVSGDATPDSFS